MVKHTQTIVGSLPKNCVSVFDHFVELALKVLIAIYVGTNNLSNKGDCKEVARKDTINKNCLFYQNLDSNNITE